MKRVSICIKGSMGNKIVVSHKDNWMDNLLCEFIYEFIQESLLEYENYWFEITLGLDKLLLTLVHSGNSN